jgi:hypothetical protein
MMVTDRAAAVVDLQGRRALVDLFDRLAVYEAEAERCLAALCAADYRADLCVGSIASRLGVDETARRTSWPAARVDAALAVYTTARDELAALHTFPAERGGV